MSTSLARMSDLPGPIVLNATVQYNLSLTDDLDLLDVFAEDVVTVSTTSIGRSERLK